MPVETSPQALRSIGVLLINTGSPKEPQLDAVERYLQEFLGDPHIVSMNPFIWKLLVRFCIIPKRKEMVTRRYASIWNNSKTKAKQGSPLVEAQDHVARRLEKAFARDERAANVRIFVRSVMNYGEPRIEWIMQEFKNLKLDEVVIFPTFPQYSYSASQSCIDHAYEIAERFGLEKQVSCIEDYHVHPAYISALAYSAFIKGFDESLEDELLFSYHSIPLAHVRNKDNYETQCQETTRALALAMCLKDTSYHHAYQSMFGKEEQWLGPRTKHVLYTLGKKGKKRIFLMCPGFAFECLETLVDIPDIAQSSYQDGYRDFLEDVQSKTQSLEEESQAGPEVSAIEEGEVCKEDAEEAPLLQEEDLLPEICYIPCLGDTQLHVKVLKEVLSDHLSLDLLSMTNSESLSKIYEDFAQSFVSQNLLDKTDTFPRINPDSRA